jgi:hypothetical protein
VNKSQRIGLRLVEGEDTNVHLASACCKKQIMLFVEVKMTHSKTITKSTSRNMRAQVAAVPKSEFALSLLVET